MELNVLVSELKKILNEFTPQANEQKKNILKECSSIKKLGKRDLANYYDSLIFLSAHPSNKETNDLVKKEILRLEQQVNTNENLQEKLSGSGILNSPVRGGFSFTLINWLMDRLPGQVYLHSFGEGVHPREILKNVLLEMEFELSLDEKRTPEKWIERSSGYKNKSKQLEWLINGFLELKCSELIRDHLFESTQLFVEIRSKDERFSKAGCKLSIPKTFFHKEELLKKFDFNAVIKKPVLRPNKVDLDEIVDVSRFTLLFLNRETDPITYCGNKPLDHNIKYFELERGLSIAFFSTVPKRRLPLESYIGFMMYKNGFPISYGGAWLFGKRALIGINIFEWFRGGESGFLFSQLIRSYHQVFGADYFEVEPYQFGKGNPEGINSGAFWFYYKFGFRPVNETLRYLSDEEAKRISQSKGHRTSKSTLRAFTGSNIYLNLNNVKVPLNPSEYSNFISKQISEKHEGDRVKAFKELIGPLGKKGIKRKNNLIGFDQIAPFIFFCLNDKELKVAELKKLNRMIKLKQFNEFDYALFLNQFNWQKLLNENFLKYMHTKYPKLR